jgi:hypothetical protein
MHVADADVRVRRAVARDIDEAARRVDSGAQRPTDRGELDGKTGSARDIEEPIAL